MHFFVKSENSLLVNPENTRKLIGKTLNILLIFLLFNYFLMTPLMCECRRTEKNTKYKKVQTISDNIAGEFLVQSNVLKIVNSKKGGDGGKKSSTTKSPDLKEVWTMGRSGIDQNLIENGSKSQTNALPVLSEDKKGPDKEKEMSDQKKGLEKSQSPTTTIMPLHADQENFQANNENDLKEETNESLKQGTNDFENDIEDDSYDLPVDDEHIEGKDFDDYTDYARSAEEKNSSSGGSESFTTAKAQMTTTSRTTISTTQVTNPTSKSVRTKYPFLKKVPARLVASFRPQTKRPIRSTTPKLKKGSLKPQTRAPRPRPSTPIPEHFNPHHPHGIVVFDKRRRHPKPGKPGRSTAATTTTSAPRLPAVATNENNNSVEDDDDWGSAESQEITEAEVAGDSSSSNTTVRPTKPTKVPLSKLAIAMISSSSNFNNGNNTNDTIHYKKTPVNLLYVLQAYAKQFQLTSGNNNAAGGSETLNEPIRIQSTPFMLQLNQLNLAARLGISVYYSLIAILPLLYFAFGGIGRLGFLNGVRKRRRKRNTFHHDYFRDEEEDDSNHQNFNRKRHFQIQMHMGNSSALKRADLNDDGIEDEYTWILQKISEIILEYSFLTPEKKKQG